jgi:dTDP-4-dehydrorhamnose reductase
MKKIIIVGSNSYIAKQLINRLKKEETFFTTVSSRSDKSDFKLDLEYIDQFDFNKINKNDLVIFLAAISSPDVCRKEFKKSFNINVIGTIKFIEESIRRNANVLFFSSDTVYGTENGQNNEDVIPIKPMGEYASMKLSVENYFRNEPNLKIFRLSYVFSWNDKFMKYLHICRTNNTKVEVFHPFIRKMVYINDVIDGIIKLTNNWNYYDQQIFNFCGSKQYSRLDIVELYNKCIYPLNYEISNPPDNFYKARPELIHINSKNTEFLLGRKFTNIEKAIKIEKLNN